jgi:hypothetical protein
MFEAEVEFYQKNRNLLIQLHGPHKWVLIQNKTLIGVYDSLHDAYVAGFVTNLPFFIKHLSNDVIEYVFNPNS